jgi:hypothetical protein
MEIVHTSYSKAARSIQELYDAASVSYQKGYAHGAVSALDDLSKWISAKAATGIPLPATELLLHLKDEVKRISVGYEKYRLEDDLGNEDGDQLRDPMATVSLSTSEQSSPDQLSPDRRTSKSLETDIPTSVIGSLELFSSADARKKVVINKKKRMLDETLWQEALAAGFNPSDVRRKRRNVAPPASDIPSM